MASFVRRFVWLAAGLVMLMGVATAGGGLYVQRQLQHSLPLTSGDATVTGLSAPVIVDRDALGVPKITAASRADAARALGFVHAQDRFFQMDLQRRQPAGELSALVGARALKPIAQPACTASATSPAGARAGRAGVSGHPRGLRARRNAGLAALARAPIEYLVLRAVPEPWKPEDSILTVLAMFNTLQGRQAEFEMTFGAIARHHAAARCTTSSPHADRSGMRRSIGEPLRFVRQFRLRTCSTCAASCRKTRLATDRHHSTRACADGAVAIAAPWLRVESQTKPPASAATTGRSPARTPPRAPRWSPTTCISRSTCRTSGIARRWSFPMRATPARRCAHRHHAAGHARAWSSAATATSPGASPIPAATGATWSSSNPILVTPNHYLTPRWTATDRALERADRSHRRGRRSLQRASGRSGARSSARTIAAARSCSVGWRTIRRLWRRHHAAGTGARSSRKRCTRRRSWHSRRRTSSPAIDGANRVDHRRADSAPRRIRRGRSDVVGGRRASLERLPHRRRSIRVLSIPPSAGCGRRTRRSSTGDCSARSAKAVMPTASARASSAIA